MLYGQEIKAPHIMPQRTRTSRAAELDRSLDLMNSLNTALKQFEATEANLAKAEVLWAEIKGMIPGGIAFGDTTNGIYDDRCRAFRDIHKGLPQIDGWAMPVCLFELNEIGQMRLDAEEVGEFECKVQVEESILEQEKHLKEYRYRFSSKRRQLVRSKLLEIVDRVDSAVRELSDVYPDDFEKTSSPVEGSAWDTLKADIAVIDTLLGGSVKRPTRWVDLYRHMHFGLVTDFHDIRNLDWPAVKSVITKNLYGRSDAIPVEVEDLGALVASQPSGEVITKLKWEILDEEEFERLLFCLVSQSAGYENPEWLTRTNASDRGRDLSVARIFTDTLGGTIRQRVIIQCKHWLSKSVNLQEVSASKEQMSLWAPPWVDVLTIATSGRFTTDAIQYVEKNNQADTRLRVEMWAESHLERLLVSRPALIAEFRLR